MREIVERLKENRQIELAKSILESNGYKITKKSKRIRESNTEPSALKELLDLDGGELNYNEYPEMFDIYGEEALSEITKFLGCEKEDLIELLGRDEGLDIEGYQELCDYIYDNSNIVEDITSIEHSEKDYGPFDSLNKSKMTDGTGAKYVFHMSGDSFPGFIISSKVK